MNELATQPAKALSSQRTGPPSLKSLITSDVMKAQFAAALPKHLSVERFCRIAITALSRTPKLMECTQESLMKCLLDLSAYGIEPDGRRAHLIPYGNQCTLILDWKGLAELALRSGIIAKLHADIVCENDEFEFNLGEIVRHKVDYRKPRGEMYAVYALAVTKDGPVFVQVLTKDEVDAVRKRSRASSSGPWVTDYHEMAKKTAFRRLSKWLPLSAEFREASERDDDRLPERDVTPQVSFAPAFETLPASDSTPGDSQPAAAVMAPPAAAGESEPAPSTTEAAPPVGSTRPGLIVEIEASGKGDEALTHLANEKGTLKVTDWRKAATSTLKSMAEAVK